MKKIIARITSLGQRAFVALAPPQGTKLGTLYASSDLSAFVNGLFKFAITIGAMGAVIRLAYAGYLYMGQADMWSHKGQAKEIIGDVTLGVLLLLAIWLILYQVNPDILKLNALKNIKPVQTSGAVQGAPAGGGAPAEQSPDASQLGYFGQ